MNSMNLPLYENLDIAHLQRLFDNMAESYKLFWFRAILESVNAGRTTFTYDELINRMISDAWYMVNEYRLNLGPRDNLEALVKHASELTGLKSSENREKIIECIAACGDDRLKKYKQTLTQNVPYRLQAPIVGFRSADFDGRLADVAEKINSFDSIIYKFDTIKGLNSVITVDEKWAEYFRREYEILSGWINFHLIRYLQRRNPSIPGIPNKLEPPAARSMAKVTKYWKAIADVMPIHEIYGDSLIGTDISIDHFVPWSYVAHDELWNLSPTTRSINSSKSNNLPDWDAYFRKLSELEFTAYQASYEYFDIQGLFAKCLDEHVNSEDVRQKLYRPGLSREEFGNALESVILPSYTAAKNLGFHVWSLP